MDCPLLDTTTGNIVTEFDTEDMVIEIPRAFQDEDSDAVCPLPRFRRQYGWESVEVADRPQLLSRRGLLMAAGPRVGGRQYRRRWRRYTP